MTTKTSTKHSFVPKSANPAVDIATALSRMNELLEKHIYASALVSNVNYMVSEEWRQVGEVGGRFYNVYYDVFGVNPSLDLTVELVPGVVQVGIAKARLMGRDATVLGVNLSGEHYHIPPRDLRDTMFLLLNQHLLAELTKLSAVNPFYVSLFAETASRILRRPKMCAQILNQMALRGRGKLEGTPFATYFELDLHQQVLRAVGTTPVFYDIDNPDWTDTLYYAWVDINGKLEKLLSREPSGLALILRSTVPERELRSALDELEKVVKVTAVSPATFLSYWSALKSLET